MSKKIVYHTRHIPTEHLDFSTEMGKQVKKNGLCDVLEANNIELLKEYGVDTVELRLVWWEFEPQPGIFDWSRFERDLERVEQTGLKPGLMAWLNHPPEWYQHTPDRAEFFRCLEHGEETTTLSLWDPKTIKIKDRLYKIISERYKDRLDFIYMMFSGDYGEPVLPQGVQHYEFSSPHAHSGIFWTGDKFARAFWRKYLQQKYKSIDKLNIAWQTEFISWENDLLDGITDLSNINTRRRLDYMRWVTESTTDYAKKIYCIIRKYFPDIRTAVPIGHCSESNEGQLKSLCVKKIAEKDKIFTVRWTGMANLKEFSRSNVLANRVSSIARFYGADFGEEAALIIDSDNAAAALYEGLSNGMSMLHNDIGNIQRAGTVSTELFKKMIIDPPVNKVALFYPVEQEMLKAFEDDYLDFIDIYFKKAGELRFKTDYDICDTVMICDGFLKNKGELVFIVSSVIAVDVLPLLREFVSAGGEIKICNNSNVTIIETGKTLKEEISKVKIIKELAEYPEYEKLKQSPDEFVTIHKNHVSRFSPEKKMFFIEAR